MEDDSVSTKSEKMGGYDKWEISNAFETLENAREILADDKKVKAISVYAGKQRKAT